VKIVVKKEMKPGEILEELLKKRGYEISPIMGLHNEEDNKTVYDVLGVVAEELFVIYREHLKSRREEGTD